MVRRRIDVLTAGGRSGGLARTFRVTNLLKQATVESFVAGRAMGNSPRAGRDRATVTVLISISLVTKDST